MAQAYIVEALRTAGGKRKGALAGTHPADLGAAVINALVARTGIDAAALQVRLLELELDGLVARLPGGLFQRMGTA